MCSKTNRLKEKDEGIFSIKELFEKEIELKVPLYQRKYAWGKKELDQLFCDIYGQMKGGVEEYFIGTLVIFKKGSLYDIVDGQQRVTTLLLILLTLKENSIKRKLRLRYAARESIEKIFESNLEKLDLEECKEITINKNIIENLLNSLDEEDRQKFNEYFLKKVKLVVTILPGNTDVNKYFEIMNTRGKQLELHEILKARFLSGIEEDNKNRFSILWDICADMDTHVSKKIKDCKSINIKEYSQILDFNASGKENTNKKSLRKILGSIDENLNNTKENQKAEVDENEGKYKSIINFPNFLCIVRKILEKTSKDNISLDDKNLLKNFEDKLKLDGNKFILDLLNYRLLFDSFIIRREEKKDWVLKKCIQENNKSYGYRNTFSNNEDNEDKSSKKIRQLQGMLQVSFSTQTYKNWLYEVLKFLGEKSVDIKDVKELSQNLVSDNEKTFYIKLKEIAKEAILSNDVLKDKLNNGVRTPHSIFHLLDYIIWEKTVESEFKEYKELLGVEEEFKSSLKKFRFMYCNSIEHVYPQSEKINDNFGNLCLITKEFNSSLSDSSYKSKKAKFEEYLKHQESFASLKQAIIFSMRVNKDEWTEEYIKIHEEKMIKLLKEF
ncbi:DUF262 domain-containing protein [Cetobacterium sp.]|uniref:DUF262 domain-containing protein n=1 Tax=Cetobacterium sp. TaxID=2071632 RepID=UPI003F3627AA